MRAVKSGARRRAGFETCALAPPQVVGLCRRDVGGVPPGLCGKGGRARGNGRSRYDGADEAGIGGRRPMMVIPAVVRMSGDANVVACGEAANVVEVVVAERNGEIQREGCKRKPRPKSGSRPKPPHPTCVPEIASQRSVML
jgi:hypothetical protein